MNREFLFCSGEFNCSMPLVFERENWAHTMSPSRFVWDNGLFYRKHVPGERLKGVIFYADIENKEIEKENLNFFIKHNIPCWPNPSILLSFLDRHKLLENCIKFKIADDNRVFVPVGEIINFQFPYVLKIGNSHRGQGKFLITKESDLPSEWDGIATVEPFFEGKSCRLLIVNKNIFGFYYENNLSWIKNSAGAEIFEMSDCDIPIKVKEAALLFMDLNSLEIAGIDYVIDKNGKWNFLEINVFPGFYMSPDGNSKIIIENFLRNKMDFVEKLASNG